MWRLFPRRIRAKSSLTDRLYVGSLPRKIFKIFWTKWRWSWTIRGNKTSNTHGIQACLHQTPTKRRSEGKLALVRFFSRANSLEGSEMNYGCRWPLSSASQAPEKFLSFLARKCFFWRENGILNYHEVIWHECWDQPSEFRRSGRHLWLDKLKLKLKFACIDDEAISLSFTSCFIFSVLEVC